MFHFLAFNSGSVISGNDISEYPVTGIGFVCWDFSKVFSHTSRLDMAKLSALFCLFPSASLLVAHLGLNPDPNPNPNPNRI